jgi:hypothetical protein
MNRIHKHSFRMNWYLDSDFEHDTAATGRFLGKLNEIPFVLSSITKHSLKVATYSLVKLNSQSDFTKSLALAHLASTWHWKAMYDDGPHHIHLPGRQPFTANRIKSNASVDFDSWLNGIYIAMILRDIEAVKVYGIPDPEEIVRIGQWKPVPWEVPFIKFLNGIWAFDTSLLEHLKAALRGTNPDLYDAGRGNFLLQMISPLLELWAATFSDNSDFFNETLYEQQKTRHDWYAAKDEDAGNHIMEYIDLAALAACCYAQDSGIDIQVKSEYLPEFLIRGEIPEIRWPDPEWGED